MEELLEKNLFEMAQIFIERKRLWGSAASIFIQGSNEHQYRNQQEFLDWLKYKNINLHSKLMNAFHQLQ